MTSGPRALSVWAPTDRLDGGRRVEAWAGASAGGRPSIPSRIPSGLVSAEPLPARCSLFPSAVPPAAAASALTMASEVVAGLVFFENRSEQQPQPHVSRECA